MADALVKVKDFPILDNYENVSGSDRLVASHVNGSSRETVGITIDALNDKFINESAVSPEVPRNLFGNTTPSSSEGKDGDLYFKVDEIDDETVVLDSYVKMNGEWVSFKVTDDSWRNFLEGKPFDVISYDAKSVKAYAFYQNTNINRVIMPSCETIYEYAFAESSVSQLYFPNCTHVYEYAFDQCSNLEGVLDFSSVEIIGAHAFSNGSTKNPSILMENVQEIGDYAFYLSGMWSDRTYDQELILPHCTSIGQQAFGAYSGSAARSCRFSKIILPAIETIGNQAFRANNIFANDHLEVRFGPNLTTIGGTVFFWMSMGTNATFDLYCEAITPPTMGTNSLGEGCHPTHIYVPYQSVSAYKSADGWSNYESVIEAIPEEE